MTIWMAVLNISERKMKQFNKLFSVVTLFAVVLFLITCATTSPRAKIFFIATDDANPGEIRTQILKTHKNLADVSIYTYNKSSFQVNFEKIDNWALNAPDWAEKSLETLVYYLMRHAKTDLEVTRSIFRWIAENISYDTEGYFSGNYKYLTPEEVLKYRRSVCQGYADLFTAATSIAGINAITISGWAKGANYNSGDKMPRQPNHAWNGVFLEGKWYLLDCTWASGHVDGPAFIKSYDDFYFLTPPEEFIYSHFPEDAKKQLLKTPISKKDFENLPNLKPPFFKNNLKLISHPFSAFDVDSNVVISFFVPEDVSLMANLYHDNKQLQKLFIRTQREKNMYSMSVNFPLKGKFILRIYVRKGSAEGYYNWAMDYLIRAHRKKKIFYAHNL